MADCPNTACRVVTLLAAASAAVALSGATPIAAADEPGQAARRADATEEPVPEARGVVLEARLEDEAITPVTARFLVHAVEQAQAGRAECLVIVLDTPGGLVDSTGTIVKAILRSETCVVVYVPAGGRAASAGLFISLASHIAAMAPGTRIGAAHPVQVGGLPTAPRTRRPPSEKKESGDEQEPGPPPAAPLQEKVVNDTEAWARSLAEIRGRNASWAARAVSESISATANEAVREGVVDLVAADVPDLLRKIDGREVALPGGPVRLRTAGAELRVIEMWWGQRVLGVLSSPNVAFLLMIFGFYGILFELYSPGWGVAGTLGIVCLLLASFGLAYLPINYVGLALIAVALGLFVAEAFVTSFGALAVAGVVCLVLGGLMLVDSPGGFLRVSLGVVVPVALATALITVVLVGSVLRAYRGRVQTGGESLVGAEAVAQGAFSQKQEQYSGTVRLHGEFWSALSAAPVEAGDLVEVVGRKGLTLLVSGPRKRDRSA